MNKLKKELIGVFYINNLPLVMVFLGFLVFYIGLNPHKILSPLLIIVSVTLFLFLPFFGIRKFPIARYLLTMVWGFLLLGFWIILPECIDYVLITIGIVSMGFFSFDFYKQRNHSKDIKKEGLEWAMNLKNTKKYLNSKCSRQSFLRTIYYMDKTKNKKSYKKILVQTKSLGYRWYTFFPDSRYPLIGTAMPKKWARFKDWLEKFNIKI